MDTPYRANLLRFWPIQDIEHRAAPAREIFEFSLFETAKAGPNTSEQAHTRKLTQIETKCLTRFTHMSRRSAVAAFLPEILRPTRQFSCNIPEKVRVVKTLLPRSVFHGAPRAADVSG